MHDANQMGTIQPAPGGRSVAARVARGLAASALLCVGAVHLDEYTLGHYSVVPTIGWLFLVNFLAASASGSVLLAPTGRVGRPWRRWLDRAAALGGLGVATGSLVALLLAERTSVFGFMEHGYRPIIVVAIAADAVAIVALSAVLTWSDRSRTGGILPPHGALALTEGATATARARGRDHGGDLAA
jgi:hypothetical protein